MINAACSNEQKVKLTANPTTTTGKPARFDGPVRATLVSGEATSEPVPDEPNSVYLISGDQPGTSEFLLEADVDLGSDVELLSDTVTFEVSGAKAAAFGVTVGTPEPK